MKKSTPQTSNSKSNSKHGSYSMKSDANSKTRPQARKDVTETVKEPSLPTNQGLRHPRAAKGL